MLNRTVKVTLVTQWFPPEPADLWKELAIGLKSKGFDVTVVTAFPNYPYGKVYEGYKQSLNYIEYMDGVKVIRLPVFPDHSKSIFRRGLSYISFALSLLLLGSFRMPKSDILLCYSPPLTVSFVTAILAFFKRVPFILNIQDMWPDTLVASGMVSKTSRILRIIEMTASWIYKRSKFIVVLSEGFKKHLEVKYNLKGKVCYIPNLTHHLEIDKNSNRKNIRNELNISQSDFVYLYAGNMGEAQQIDVIIDAFSKASVNNAKLLLVGDGIQIHDLQQRVERKNIENVIFAGRVSSSKVALYYEISDILLIHLKNDDLFKITIPHKIISYLEVGKPILAAVPGEVNSIVKLSESGMTCDSENSDVFAECMKAMACLSVTERKKMGNNARKYYDISFARETIISSWNELIKRALK